jgi:colicin import membrane protein
MSRLTKLWCEALAGLLLPCMALAQTPSTIDVATETARIQLERQQVDARIATDEAGCYQHFSVTDCLEAARGRRRDALADLRRQELSMQDSQRKRQGAEQLQRLDEKADAATSAGVLQRRTEALQQQAERQQRTNEKLAERLAKQPAADVAKKTQEAQAQRAEKVADRVSQAQAGGRTQQQFDAKVKEAKERKASRLADVASQPKSSLKSLPVPP